MTREEARKAAEVMLAYADGEKIERYDDYKSEWEEVTNCIFDWFNYNYRVKPKEKFDPKTLKPFDKVLARYYTDKKWGTGFFSHPLVLRGEQGFVVDSNFHIYVIPYNDDTKHLVGTSDDAPEYYCYWEE